MRPVPRISVIVLALVSPWLCVSGALAVESLPRVHLEIAAEKRGTLEGPQQWIRTLEGVPFASIRIRSAQPADQPKIEQTGTGPSATYRVLGLLAPGNDLFLPGAKIRAGDRAGVERWLSTLSQNADAAGTEGMGGPAQLPLKQLEAAILRLAPPVRRSTRGRPLREVIQEVDDELDLRLTQTAEVKNWLDGGSPVQDELEGVSAGTALSAALRSAGLVLLVDNGSTPPGFRIVRHVASQDDSNLWPVGWTSTLPSTQTAPKLFEKLEVEMKDTPYQRAVDALQARIQLPILYDHVALADRQIRSDAGLVLKVQSNHSPIDSLLQS